MKNKRILSMLFLTVLFSMVFSLVTVNAVIFSSDELEDISLEKEEEHVVFESEDLEEIETEKEVSQIEYLKGDLNRDGLVNADDASYALDIYKYGNVTEDELSAGDMNGDGVINADDASIILDVYKSGE